MLLALAFAFLSNEAWAFELTYTRTATGAELRWDPPALSYGAVFGGEEEFAAACRSAADRWVLGSRLGVSLTWSGPHAALEPNDGLDTIAIVSEWDARLGDPERTVAHTEQFYDVDTGLMREADVRLNGEAFTFGGGDGAYATESVVLHELGHVLGINHPCGLAWGRYPSCFSVPESEQMRILEAVMAPTLAPGVVRVELNEDDRAALDVHYSGSATGDPPAPPRVQRDCPGGALSVDPMLPTTLRFADGSTREFSEWEGSADVIVRDPSTGLFAVSYRANAPAPCGAPPDPEDGGCACGAHRQHAKGEVMLLVALGFVMLVRRRRWLLLSLVLALSTPFASEALAYKCSRVGGNLGPSLIWPTRTIAWYADEALFDIYGDRIGAEEDVRAGFQAWVDVPCSDIELPLAAIIRDLRAGYDSGGDNKNAVVAHRTGWPYDRAALAVTTTAYDTRTGVVVDADIEINAEHFTFARVDDTCEEDSGLMDVRNTVTHEVGHVVGLDHPPDTSRYEEVTMYASAPTCEIKKRTLEQDDIDGICTIYPTGLPSRQCYPPEGPSFIITDSDDGFGCTSVSGQGGAQWLLVFMACWLPRRWIRRRRS